MYLFRSSTVTTSHSYFYEVCLDLFTLFLLAFAFDRFMKKDDHVSGILSISFWAFISKYMHFIFIKFKWTWWKIILLFYDMYVL
jgi:hypothetical protein